MQVEAAQDLVRSDPDRAVTMLADLLDQTESAVRETRQMAHTHRPPALDALGLVAALQAHISHLTAVPVRMTVPRTLPPLPAAVEVAAYRIALEALANVIAHASARSCRLRVTHDGDRLLIEVDDDGRGITEGQPAGIGQQSMRERAEELGGSLAVHNRQDGPGTTVVVALPCAPPDGPSPTSSIGPESSIQKGSPWVA